MRASTGPASCRRVAASRRPPPRPSGSASPTASTSAPEAGERVDERLLVSGAARDDHARHAALDEPGDAVGRQGNARHRHERLRQSLRRLAQPLRLAAGEQERFHQADCSR